MSLRGSLESFTLQDILQLLTFSSKSGALRISGPGEDAVVWCDAGAVTYAAVDPDESTQALVRAGLVDADALADAVTTSESWGEALVERGAIERERLVSFIEERVADTLHQILLWKSGEFEFVPDGQPAVGRIAALAVEPLFVTALGRVAEWQALRAVVPLDGRVARLVRHLPGALTEITITSGLWQVIAAVDGAHDPREIAASIGRGEFETSQALRELVERGLVEFVEFVEFVDAAPRALTTLAHPLEPLAESPSEPLAPAPEPVVAEVASAAVSAAVVGAEPAVFEPDLLEAEPRAADAIAQALHDALADTELGSAASPASDSQSRSPGAALLKLPREPSFAGSEATANPTPSAEVPTPPAPVFIADPGGDGHGSMQPTVNSGFDGPREHVGDPIGALWLARWEATNVVPDAQRNDGRFADGQLPGDDEGIDHRGSASFADDEGVETVPIASSHEVGGDDPAIAPRAASSWSDRWASFDETAEGSDDARHDGAVPGGPVAPVPLSEPSAGPVFAEEPPVLPRRDSLSARREGLSDRLGSQWERAPIAQQGPSDDRRGVSNVPALRPSSYTDRYAHLYEDLDDALGDEHYERTAADLPRRASLASVGSSSDAAPSRRGRNDDLPRIDRNVLLRMLSAVKDL